MKILIKLVMMVLATYILPLNAQTINQVNGKGEKTGKWVKHFDNNKIKYEGQFRNDRPYGKFTYYCKKGKVKAVSVFSDDGIIAHNTTYYTNGKLMAVGKYVDQQKDSIWNYYIDEESNPIVSTETYANGTLNGESITYYPDTGEPAEIIYYENGKKNGKLLKYFPDGKLMTESYYKNGLPDGDFTHYHPDGKVQIDGKHKYGRQVGEWKYYDEKGNRVDEDEFRKQDEVRDIGK